ncbi:hypothetical protein [Chroococcidiopsis sp. CCMEE 29]|uniref:hypothetical protein n=1 Tax=Chroococcidiopsis sp. CCMEE 29 TaxID=155894 RepID=UPI0020218F1E|nr:hypothetical protein [Chroococcidiopsis sp. CCMEE 29]
MTFYFRLSLGLIKGIKWRLERLDWIGQCLPKDFSITWLCVHGDPDNLDSLRDKRQQGNYRKATEEYIELLLELAEKHRVNSIMNLAGGQHKRYQII